MMIPVLDLLVCFLCLPALLNDILYTIVKAVLFFLDTLRLDLELNRKVL